MNLKKQYIFFLCILFIAGIIAKRQRIFGGTRTAIEDYPHLVSFRSFLNIHFCGGSIVSKNHILSAAHCFVEFKNDFSGIRVHAGTSKLTDSAGSEYQIYRIFNYPLFKWNFKKLESPHDICVVQIRGEISFNNFQKIIKLPTRDVFNENIGVVVGWGLSRHDNLHLSDALLRSPMTLYQHKTCIDRTPLVVFEDQFCAFYSPEVGTCETDSGGSVISNEELYGIISRSYKCANGLPDIHTKVYYYLPFIKSIIE